MDIRDLHRRRLSIRQLCVLTKSLLKKQGRSTLLAALEPRAEWSVEAYTLARVSDAQEVSNYLYQMVNTSEEAQQQIPVPTPIPRPGVPLDEESEQQPRPDFASGEELSSFFARMSGL